MSLIDASGGKAAELMATLKLLMADAGTQAATSGQLIKGKVMRVLSDGQYSIQFGKREVIVDSNLSLRANDAVLARVSGNGELSLAKAGTEALSRTPDSATPVQSLGVSSNPQAGGEWLATHLSPSELALVQAAIAASGEEDALNQIAMMLKKAGLEVSAPLLSAVRAALHAPINQGVFETRLTPPIALTLRSLSVEENSALNRTLGELMAGAMGGQVERASAHRAGEVASPQNEDIGQLGQSGAGLSDGERDQSHACWALNLQQGGSIQHRVASIPLLLDGQLVELSVALFDERGARDEDPRRGFSKVVFDLNLPTLGHVTVKLAGIGTHLDVALTAADANASRNLLESSDALRTVLHGLGWQVDRMRYFTELGGAGRAPVRAVLQHQIAGDSLARWV